MNKLTIYCDGAYSPARNTTGAGVVILQDEKIILKFGKRFEGGTNNTAELCAVILAMVSIKKPVDEIEIITDSMYVIGTLTKNWTIRANIKLWNRLKKCLEKLKLLCPKITFTWVKGHASNPYNNLADMLAVNASTAYIDNYGTGNR